MVKPVPVTDVTTDPAGMPVPLTVWPTTNPEVVPTGDPPLLRATVIVLEPMVVTRLPRPVALAVLMV